MPVYDISQEDTWTSVERSDTSEQVKTTHKVHQKQDLLRSDNLKILDHPPYRQAFLRLDSHLFGLLQ
jgi:hypothetical protein